MSAVANQPTNHPTVAPVVEAGVGSQFPRERKRTKKLEHFFQLRHTHILACKNWWLSDSRARISLTDWLTFGDKTSAAAAWAWAWELVWHRNEGAQKWNARRQLLLLLPRQKLCRQTRHWNGQQTKEVSAAAADAENGKEKKKENARNLQNRGIGEKREKERAFFHFFCFFSLLFSFFSDARKQWCRVAEEVLNLNKKLNFYFFDRLSWSLVTAEKQLAQLV